MKRWLILGLVLLIGIGALVVAEMRKADAPVSPRALLNFLADAQREVSRVPMRVTRMSDEEEIRIGHQIAQSYLHLASAGGGGVNPPLREAYIRKVGNPLAFHARRKLPFEFHYIPNPEFINAFALPGGHIFMGEGLLARMTSEDELASVLGHEIEHVDLYHCAERAQVEAQLRKIPLGGLVGLPITIFQAGYSKAQELEADREGVRLAVRMGYSPYGAIKLFETMERMREKYAGDTADGRARRPQEEISQVAMETLRGYFRSHPLPAERIQQVREMIAQLNWGEMTTLKPLATTAAAATPPAAAPAGRMERKR